MSSVQPTEHDALGSLFVRFAATGCETSFGKVYAELNDVLRALAYRVLRNHADTDDLVQEAWVRIHRNKDRYDPHLSPFRGWAIGILTNLLKNDHRNRSRKRVFAEAEFQLEDEGKTSPLRMAVAPSTPDRIAFARMDRQHLKRILKTLPRNYRRIAILRYGLGFSNEEAAARLGLELGSARAQSYRAWERLRKAWDEYMAKNGDG